VCADFIWCQEEHRNDGAWSFVAPRFQNIVGIKVFIGPPLGLGLGLGVITTEHAEHLTNRTEIPCWKSSDEHLL